MALPRKYRLSKKKDIDYVFKKGRTVRDSSLFIKFIDNRIGYPRFVFIVPSKCVSLAVDRNKIKRIFSEETIKLPLPERGYDIAVVVYKKIVRSRFRELSVELREVMLKLV